MLCICVDRMPQPLYYTAVQGELRQRMRVAIFLRQPVGVMSGLLSCEAVSGRQVECAVGVMLTV